MLRLFHVFQLRVHKAQAVTEASQMRYIISIRSNYYDLVR